MKISIFLTEEVCVMADFPKDDAVRRAVDAARSYLPPEDAAKIQRLATDPAALKNLTAGMSQKDWANVMRVMNDPQLLKMVLSSSKGQAGLRGVLDRIE